MVPFAGYDMPVQYPTGILKEHEQCRGKAALFDVSDSIFLGAEARFQMVFADPDMVKALIFLAHGGMRF